jgi:DNA-directed RNA polymerase subunit RPC12/RpoP
MKTKIDLTCPKCEANLSVNADRDFLFCEYCGAKILLNDENTYTIRKVDEAEIIHAENERLIYLKELEITEKKAEAEKERQEKLVKFSIFLAFVGVLLIITGVVARSFSVSLMIAITAPCGGLLLIIAFCLVMTTFFPDQK